MANRVDRMLRILFELRTQRPFNAYDLASECGVHRRTVFRDIAAIRTLGFDVAFDPDSACYTLLPYAGRHWGTISDDELKELFLSACLRADPSGNGTAAIRRAAIKHLEELTGPLRDRLLNDVQLADGLMRAIRIPDPPTWVPAVWECIRQDFSVVLSFDGGDASAQPIRLRPCSLLLERQGWVLVGSSSEADRLEFRFHSARLGWEQAALDCADDTTAVGLVIRERHLPP